MLREYTSADRNAAVALYMNVFSGEPFHYEWLDTERIHRYFTDMENTPGFIGFIWERDGVVAGICVGSVQDYFACCAYEIKEFIVSSKYRHHGVGTALLSGAEAMLAERGVEIMSLATSTELTAFEFYKKNGYEASGNTVWMGKMIAH